MTSNQAFLFVLLVATLFDVGLCRGDDDSTPVNHSITLRSGVSIPLLGMGVGNLPREDIPMAVFNGLNYGNLLIDTARASDNERVLGESVARFDNEGGAHRFVREGGGGPGESQDLEEVHVVTKVWYTHLGYERTKISVQQSLADLAFGETRQVYVHVLLHWPRCDDSIPWMNCEQEENNLPLSIKNAGPPPHLDKKGAFKESWKALEEIYMEHQREIMRSQSFPGIHPPIVVSIGVSNFELEDMHQIFLEKPRVAPQMYQGNVWAVFNDPYLMKFLKEHDIFFQAYGVMNGILQRKDQAPNAYNILSGISRELVATVPSHNEKILVTEATVLIAFFLHSNIGVIPRSAHKHHQKENSLESVSAIFPYLTSSHIQQLETAIPALLKGEDLHTAVSFMNALTSPIQIHWLNPDSKEEVLVSKMIHPGSVEVQKSYPGHTFVAYDPDRLVRKEFTVDAGYGERQDFRVEL